MEFACKTVVWPHCGPYPLVILPFGELFNPDG